MNLFFRFYKSLRNCKNNCRYSVPIEFFHEPAKVHFTPSMNTLQRIVTKRKGIFLNKIVHHEKIPELRRLSCCCKKQMILSQVHRQSRKTAMSHMPEEMLVKHSHSWRVQHYKYHCRHGKKHQGLHRFSTNVPHSTIYALSSGHGKCGVAVIRVSGPEAREALCRITQKSRTPEPRMAVIRRLFHPQSGHQIDRGLALWFPGPESFTGEDCCEFQVHGGPAVVAAMLDALSHISGCRAAEAGEFTKRAFMNMKLDLTEVEGLADLIHAETEAQRRQALRQMEGALAQLYSGWRRKLLKCTANVEAYIDFSEEDNIEEGVMSAAIKSVAEVYKEICNHLKDKRRGERLREGVQIAIVGEPNVGKSSLLNAISQRPAAIVSPIAGTTRDVVETALNLGGYPVLLSDTAGLRETNDVVESEGVARALDRAKKADLKILVLEAAKHKDLFQLGNKETFQDHVKCHMESLGLDIKDSLHYHDTTLKGPEYDCEDIIVVFNKSDLLSTDKMEIVSSVGNLAIPYCVISCTTESGLDEFLTVLLRKVKYLCDSSQLSSPSLTQARHRHHLNLCREFLEEFDDYATKDIVLAAHALRNALRHVGKITGQVSSEEILDVIFRDFCIGK